MDWNIVKTSGTCGRCEKSIREEEIIYSCLFLDNTSFSRTDFCEDCWNNNAGIPFFSFWKTRIPKKDESKKKAGIAADCPTCIYNKPQARAAKPAAKAAPAATA